MQSMDPGHLFTTHTGPQHPFSAVPRSFARIMRRKSMMRMQSKTLQAFWKCETSGGACMWCSPPETRLHPAGTPVWSRKHNLYLGGNLILISEEVERSIEEARNCLFPKWRT